MATSTWKRAPFDPLRLVKLKLRWKTGKFDSEGYLINGPAVDIFGRNRYTKVPVSLSGLTSSAHAFQEWMKVNFPDSPTKVNYGVDRARRKSSKRSDHALGQACDVISQKYDGKLGISPVDTAWGTKVFNAVVADMQEGLRRGLRRRNWDGRWVCGVELDTDYVLFNGWICKASEMCVPRRIRSGDPHRDHLHWSCGPRDLPVGAVGWVIDPKPKEARRTLRYRGRAWPKVTGEDVKLVQEVVGAKVDGWFGPMTSYKVKLWQKAQGLKPDGIVGPKTWAKLDQVTAP